MTDQPPTIGRIVWYRTDGRNGLSYDLPAIVTCTRDTHPGDYPDGRRNPLPVPDEGCVHLTVFTPGGFGTQVRDSTDALKERPGSGDFPNAGDLIPGSGTYVEWNVPSNDAPNAHEGYTLAPDGVVQRSWRWPVRVP